VASVSGRIGRGGRQATVEAAGGVVWRVGADGLEVVLVHRPKYDDWTFPKGKLDPGETFEEAALREVVEETGLRCVLGHELEGTRYVDAKGRPKVVRYWEMTVASGDFVVNDEVDELVWLPLERVGPALTYGHDAQVLASFARFAGEATSGR
jgi:8-oxo-dGTP pyrophosphatase MutT (NUDIX family)